MEKASKSFPPGIKYNQFYRTKTDLDESIKQVEHTLIEAFVLVFIVVFIFLAGFQVNPYPCYSRSGGYYRYILFHECIWVLH
jgi:HAE1 family hydrophobic/amphiphilic exporter-1